MPKWNSIGSRSFRDRNQASTETKTKHIAFTFVCVVSSKPTETSHCLCIFCMATYSSCKSMALASFAWKRGQCVLTKKNDCYCLMFLIGSVARAREKLIALIAIANCFLGAKLNSSRAKKIAAIFLAFRFTHSFCFRICAYFVEQALHCSMFTVDPRNSDSDW